MTCITKAFQIFNLIDNLSDLEREKKLLKTSVNLYTVRKLPYIYRYTMYIFGNAKCKHNISIYMEVFLRSSEP